VKVSYFDILKAARILAVAKQSVEQLKAHRDTAQGFFDVGIIPRNDLLYAEVELANGRQFLLRAENGLEIAAYIPFEPLVAQFDGQGKPVTEIPKDSPASIAIDEICKKILSYS
jgi:CO dehydrogenase nickel-insertion accessory protein CooC1